MTEAQAYQVLRERGFEDLLITTSYSMEGKYFDPIEVSDQGADYHPLYEAIYEGGTGELWTISIVGQDITAYPIYFNLESPSEKALIVAEDEIVTSYDSVTNTYYKNIPDEGVLKIKLVDRVDKASLDKMKIEELGQ